MNKKLNQIAMGLLIFTILACSGLPATPVVDTQPSTPSPTVTKTMMPTSTSTITPTRTSRPTPTTTPLPDWVTNFAEPILAAIKEYEPSFQDDFSYSFGNGWFIGYLGNPQHGLTVEKGILLVKGCEQISNLALTHPNFVLQIDIPGNYGELVFHGFIGGGPSYFFSIQGRGATLRWSFGSRDNNGIQQFGDLSGDLEETISAGNRPQAIIIKKGSKAAFYLNETPLAYIDDPILDEPIHGVILSCGKFDNIKFWNLDKIPSPP